MKKTIKTASAILFLTVLAACGTEAEACDGVTGHELIAAFEKAQAENLKKPSANEFEATFAKSVSDALLEGITKRIDSQPEGRDVCITKENNIFNG
ncbi:hypothetical protein [Roseibium aggregatum]|uniref:Lipoprotein n=1 Tax=Roseibium aggregatum TaxID=187304 RepID=A0A0M6Y8W9_9HYPH|nr:hypothetical protein [Roseibium aggregatum]CTQ45717.1 hypothetical protein LAL4801_04172 [Roseibium aggregatum]